MFRAIILTIGCIALASHSHPSADACASTFSDAAVIASCAALPVYDVAAAVKACGAYYDAAEPADRQAYDHCVALVSTHRTGGID